MPTSYTRKGRLGSRKCIEMLCKSSFYVSHFYLPAFELAHQPAADNSLELVSCNIAKQEVVRRLHCVGGRRSLLAMERYHTFS